MVHSQLQSRVYILFGCYTSFQRNDCYSEGDGDNGAQRLNMAKHTSTLRLTLTFIDKRYQQSVTDEAW